MRSARRYSANLNGPVPIGSWSIFSGVPAFSIASAYSFDCTPAYSIARFDRNGASGLSSVMRTV